MIQHIIDENHIVFEMPSKMGGGNALIQTTQHDTAYGSKGLTLIKNGHVAWGRLDNQPNIMRQLVMGNNLVEALMEAQRDMIFGSGLGFARREVDATTGKVLSLDPIFDSMLEDWREAIELDQFLIDGINQRVFSANLFTRVEWDIKNKWPKLNVSDVFFTRLGLPVNGSVLKYAYNPLMGEWGYKAQDDEEIEAFDKTNPVRHQVSILHSKELKPGNPFYAFPSWWTSEKSIQLANLIPEFHINGIVNGYNIKYLIKMPKDYYDNEFGKESDPKAVKAKWDAFGDKMQRWFGNTKNVNKTLVVKYKRGEDGKALDNIEVIPMKNELSDEAYSQIWDSSNVQLTNATGLPPLLAGVTPSSRGGGSGSEIRNTSDYYQHYRTGVHRHVCLEPIRLAMRAMGVGKDIIPVIKGVQLTTLDKNPAGVQGVMNSNQ